MNYQLLHELQSFLTLFLNQLGLINFNPMNLLHQFILLFLVVFLLSRSFSLFTIRFMFLFIIFVMFVSFIFFFFMSKFMRWEVAFSLSKVLKNLSILPCSVRFLCVSVRGKVTLTYSYSFSFFSWIRSLIIFMFYSLCKVSLIFFIADTSDSVFGYSGY